MNHTIVGLGRLCVDNFLLEKRRVPRFDSDKVSFWDAGQDLGGSVPRILACLSACGFATRFVGPAPRTAEELKLVEDGMRDWRVDYTPIPGIPLKQSFVIMDAKDGKLKLDGSVEERLADQLPKSDVLETLHATQSPACIVVDARHIDAALSASSYARQHDALVALDPGNTVGASYCNEEERMRVRSLVAVSDIVFGSDNFFLQVTQADDIDGALRECRAIGPSLVLSTDMDGACRAQSESFKIDISPFNIEQVGNSLGAGDLFKGWFIAGLLSTWKSPRRTTPPEYDDVLASANAAMAASATRLMDTDMRIKIPSDEEVKAKARKHAAAS